MRLNKITNYWRWGSASSFVLSLIIIALIINVFVNRSWTHNKIIESDTFSYYTYLPSFFIRHDVTLQFLNDDHQSPFNQLWYSTSDLGVRFTKMSMGWSMMNMPFFFAAHGSAKIFNYPADGFSLPYKIAICLTTLFYVCFGLILLRKFLLQYFSETIVALTLLSIVFATNLYHYTVFEPGMTHPISFFLFACFLWLTVVWHNKTSWINSIALGLIAGLIIMTRATNTLVLLVFIFYKINGGETPKKK